MESTIKWQTGEPKEYGIYLVTLEDGSIATDLWYRFPNESDWRYYWNSVNAWCKLSDIEPYQEE